jgi:hypothetical protein
MPWPRIFSDPYRAIKPMSSEPITGTMIAHQPRWFVAGVTGAVDHRKKYAALVITAMSHRSALATTAPIAPMGRASMHNSSTRRSVLKSASESVRWAEGGATSMDLGWPVFTESYYLHRSTI